MYFVARVVLTLTQDQGRLYWSRSSLSVRTRSHFHLTLAPSFNQPRFCSNASWNPNATTFADSSTVGTNPYRIFINTLNTVFFASRISNAPITVWANGSVTPTNLIGAGLEFPYGLFVTSNDEIFVDNGCPNSRVDVWTLNQTSLSSPMFTSSRCWSLFVDINNHLYCSQKDFHQVTSKPINSPPTTTTIVAGTGCSGSSSDMLRGPRGIFVTSSLDLYVADGDNNRVQLFPSGQGNATTVAVNGASGAILLLNPVEVTLDSDGYLFILDSSNHRVVGEGADGFRCVVGCTGSIGSAADTLNYPSSLSFDNMGNIFVADYGNNRIQQFLLLTDGCGKKGIKSTIVATQKYSLALSFHWRLLADTISVLRSESVLLIRRHTLWSVDFIPLDLLHFLHRTSVLTLESRNIWKKGIVSFRIVKFRTDQHFVKSGMGWS